MDIEVFFRSRLAQLRMKKGVSAREMSLALGQNVSYINRIENGISFPSMQMFFYICDYLDITPRDFFDQGEDNPKLISSLLLAIQKLPEEKQAALLSFLTE